MAEQRLTPKATPEQIAALSDEHRETAAEWKNAELCLAWAAEQEATVAEMTAWRNMQ